MPVPEALPNETILETIERRLVPDEQAKKARGEVFTPLKLVRELLYGLRKSDFDEGSQLPWGISKDEEVVDDDEEDRIGGISIDVWRDPNTKWLDPANGIGNFPFVAFHMLDYQLKHHGVKGSKEWSDEQRRKHIVEKMLFMIEIDRGNVNTSHKIMDYLSPGSTANICCADTLRLKDEELQNAFGVTEFDVIMGNPPFNTPRAMKGQTSVLWDKFILNSLSHLTEGGYLAFVTPANWRRPEHTLYPEMISKNQLEYLHILGKRDAQRLFGVSTRIDMYIIQRTPRYAESYILDETGKLNTLDISKFPFLPNYAYSNIMNILTDEAHGTKVIFGSSTYEHRRPHVRKEKSEEFKFPVAHTITQKGVGFLYTNDNTKGHFGIPKVLLNVNEQQYPYNDYAGDYGMSQLTFGIPISSKEQGDQIVEAVNSDAFKEIIKATKWGAFQTDYRMFKYFKPDFYKDFLKRGSSRRVTLRKLFRASTRKTLR